VVAGAAPIAASMPDMHSIGNTIVNYGGALLASTLIHLFFNLITKLKKPKDVNNTTIIEKSENS
jgi:hypothetical protein